MSNSTHSARLASYLVNTTVDKNISVEENYRNLIAAALEHAGDSAKRGTKQDIAAYAGTSTNILNRLNWVRSTIRTVLKKRDPNGENTPAELEWAVGYGELIVLGIFRPKKTTNSYARDENIGSKINQPDFELEPGDYIKFQVGSAVGQLPLHFLDGNDWKTGAYTRRTLKSHKDALKRAAEAAIEKERREAEEKARKLLEVKRKTIDKEIREPKKHLEELLELKQLDTTVTV